MRDADSGNCVACPKGTYSEKSGATSCTSCPEGQTTYRAGGSSPVFCYCKKTTVMKILLTFWDLRLNSWTNRIEYVPEILH